MSSEVNAGRSPPLPTFAEEPDIYDADPEEVLVSTDAIQVKARKPTREQRPSADDTSGKEEEVKKKRISQDLMLVEGRGGSFSGIFLGGA